MLVFQHSMTSAKQLINPDSLRFKENLRGMRIYKNGILKAFGSVIEGLANYFRIGGKFVIG